MFNVRAAAFFCAVGNKKSTVRGALVDCPSGREYNMLGMV